MNRTFLRRLRWLGLIEGVSTLVLFGVAMPLKYYAGMPLAVSIAGSVHGALFLALVAMFVAATWKVPIPRRLAAAGIAGAVFPFGPFIVDRWLDRLDD